MPALKIFHAMILVLIMILPEERKGAVEAGAKPMRSHVTVARLQDFLFCLPTGVHIRGYVLLSVDK